jgi:WD40 repeat protein
MEPATGPIRWILVFSLAAQDKPPAGYEINTESELYALAFTPDGTRLIAAGQGQEIRAWDTIAWTATDRYSGTDLPPPVLSASASRTVTATAHWKGRIWLFDTESGMLLRILPGHESKDACVAVSPDGSSVVSGGGDKTIRMWDSKTGAERYALEREGAVRAVAFGPDGSNFASAGDGKTIRLYETSTGKMKSELTWDEADGYLALAFTPDGSRLVAAELGQHVVVWDLKESKIAMKVKSDTDKVRGVAVSPDGKRMAACSEGCVTVWDAVDGAKISSWKEHRGRVNAVAFSPDGLWLVSAGEDLTLRVIPLEDEARRVLGNLGQVTLTRMKGPATAMALSARGERLATVTETNVIRVWDVGTGGLVSRITVHDKRVVSVDLSEAGKLVSASEDGTVRLWDAGTGREIRRWKEECSAVAFSLDGNWVIGGDSQGGVRVWEVESGKKIKGFRGPQGSVTCVWSDGSRVAAGNKEGWATAWAAETEKEIRSVRLVEKERDARGIRKAVAAGKRLVVAGVTELRVWDLETGEERGSATAWDDGVILRPDGREAVLVEDGVARTIETESFSVLGYQIGPGGKLYSTAFSLDGKRFAASHHWNVAIGETADRKKAAPAKEEKKETVFLEDYAVSDDGRWQAMAYRDGTLVIADGSGKDVERFKRDRGWRSVEFHEGQLWTVDQKGTVEEREAGTWKVLRTIECDASVIDPRSGVYAVIQDENPDLVLGEIKNAGKQVHKLPATKSMPCWVQFDESGRHVFVCGKRSDAAVGMWDVKEGKLVREFRGHAWMVSALAENGKLLVTASRDRSIRFWDIETGRELFTVAPVDKEMWVVDVKISPDGRWVAATDGWTPQIQIFRTTTGERVACLSTGGTRAQGIAFSSDGKRILYAMDDFRWASLEFDPSASERTLAGHTRRVISVAVKGGTIYSSGMGDSVWRWDLETGRGQRDSGWLRGGGIAVAANPKGTQFAMDHWNGVHLHGGETARALKGHEARVYRLAYSGDGKKVVSSSMDRTVRIWDAESGESLRVLSGHESGAIGVAFSPDGERVVSTSRDRTVRIWSVKTGECVRVFRGHEAVVWSAEFDGPGKRVLSAGEDKILMWEAETGKELWAAQPHAGGARVARLSRDATSWASGGADGRIFMGDAGTGKIQRTLLGHSGTIWGLAFTADGKRLVSGGEDKELRVWRLE